MVKRGDSIRKKPDEGNHNRKKERGHSPLFNTIIVGAVTMAALAVLLAAPVAVAETIGFSPGDRSVSPGATTTYEIIMDTATNGLSGFDIDVSVASPGSAVITAVSFPSWAGLSDVRTGLPAGSVRICGADVNNQVKKNLTGIVLATITVRGDSAGSTDLDIHPREIDADGGNGITVATTAGHLTIQGSSTPTSTQTAAPSSSPTSAPLSAQTAAPASTLTPTLTPGTSGIQASPPVGSGQSSTPTPVPGTTTEFTFPLWQALFGITGLAIIGVIFYAVWRRH